MKRRNRAGDSEGGAGTKAARKENQVFSNRVARAEFDRFWRTSVSGGYVVYTARRSGASLIVMLTTGASKRLVFPAGGRVLVGSGGVSHYSKPHTAENL